LRSAATTPARERPQRALSPAPAPASVIAQPLLALALTHCGGKESHAEPAAAGASTGGAAAGANTGGAAAGGSAGQVAVSFGGNLVVPVGGAPPSLDCNALDDTRSSVISTAIADDPPKPQGGTLSNGFYRLSKLEDLKV